MPEKPGLNPVPFLYAALRRGVSPTRALGEFRAAGGRIRTQRWYRIATELRPIVAERKPIRDVSPRLRPPAELVVPVSSRRQRGYEYRFKVAVVNKRTGDTQLRWQSVRMSRPISIARAAAIAEATAQASLEESDPEWTAIGPVLDDVVQYGPEPEGE